MSKLIRWWGLIAFVCFVGIVLLFWLVLADGLVRRAVEKTGTALVGAEVDVRSADLTFFPLGITLSSIAVTDPSAPSSNSIELERVAFSLDALNLLRRKVIINEMAVTGIRFNTPRAKPGFVVKHPERPSAPRQQPFLTLPAANLPSAKEFLAKEQLASLTLIDEAAAEVRQKREAWQKRMGDLPDKSAMEAYRGRIEKLRAASRSLRFADAQNFLSEANRLSTDIKKELEDVKQVRSAFFSDYAATRRIVDEAARAPQDDLRKLRDKYGFSSAGLQNMSRLLFGSMFTSGIDRGFLWYGRLKPLFASSGEKKGNAIVAKPLRARGVDVRFREDHPLPNLLVSLVKASLQPSSGTFSGEIRNITPEQNVLGSPMTFFFAGSGLEKIGAVKVSGTLDHVRPAAPTDTVSLSVSGYRVSGLPLSGSSDLPITLQDGLINVSVSGQYDGKQISARIDASAYSVRFQAGSPGSPGGFAGAVRSALEQIHSFSLTADITGTPEHYEVKMTSDLDRILKDAVIRVAGDKAASFEKELSAAIQAQTGDKLKSLQDSLGGMSSLGGRIDGVQEQLNALLKDATSAGLKTKLPF
jgi:uncharacterized protein (TIGR03545 family)